MKTFQGTVRAEGSTGNLRVTIPAELLPTLTTPGWARINVNGMVFFGYVRRPPSRPTSATATLPQWCLPQLHAGQVITVVIEDAVRHRAAGSRSGFDWLPFVSEHYFPTAQGDTLVLHNRYEEPFEIRRAPELLTAYRMLGLYQAEGSKSAGALEFTFANSNARLLAHGVELLSTWGIDRTRLSLEVLRAPDDKPSLIRKLYEPLGVEIVAERVRTGAGGHAGVLHVRNSMPLLRLVRAALVKVFSEEFPSREAAREYALGWLDGDGTISIDQRSDNINLRLAGYRTEQEVALRALAQGFDRDLLLGRFGTPATFTERALPLDYAADIACAGGFTFSMSRARLIHALERRLERYKNQGRSLTAPTAAQHARQALAGPLKHETATLALHPLAACGFCTGRKGEPYPTKENPLQP